jgi:DNA polymerase I-like protein with 3'-5' exonuclease and polymerase domains
MSTIAIADIESDNLLLDATTIHCIGVKIDEEETICFTSRPIKGSSGSINECLNLLKKCDKVVFHNGIKFDIPCITKLTEVNLWDYCKIDDTLIMSQLAYPNMLMIDSNNRKLDGRLKGSHSLKSWGIRLGNYKDHYEDWSKLTEEMVNYCKQDVEVTYSLYKKLLTKNIPDEALWLEYNFARIIARQEQYGVYFDVKKAQTLHIELMKDKEKATTELHKVFTPLFLPKGKLKTQKDYVKKFPFKAQGKTIIGSHQPIIYTEFNPSSRQHIAIWFKRWYDWESPKETDKGNPIINDAILKDMDYPEASILAHYFEVNKLLGQLAEGDNAWLKMVRDDNRIHGQVNTLGAVSRRCTHCVPLTTKALTMDGWKGYEELSVGEYVLGYNLKTEKQEWTKVIDKHYFTNADVGIIGNKGNQLRCTADHKWVVMKRNRSKMGYGNPRLVKASDIKHHDAILMNADYDDYLSNHVNIPVALYLFSNKRCSRTCKTPLKGDNQRFGYNVTQTNKPFIRAKTGVFEWRYTNTEDVWCPTTELGTWVMKQEDGIITITGNSNPNMAQVPSSRAFRGGECRALFTVPKGKKLVGCDADGLELRTLSHYMARYDKGRYAKTVDEGNKDNGTDIHTVNQKSAGLPTRDDAKTFIYALMYGAGEAKLGTIVGGGFAEGKKMKDKFFNKIPALKKLTDTVVGAVRAKGYLLALDGNKYFIRSEHSALNTLLQGCGAVVMKYYLILLDENLQKKYKCGDEDYEFVLNVHDEVQIECREDIAKDIAKICVDTFDDVTKRLNFRIPLRGSADIGYNWEDTH